MRKCEEELRQQCKDRVQREQEAKLRKARRLTEATRHAARRAIDEVLAHKKEEGQAVRDRNDQAELKRQLLRNAVKASDEEVVDLAVACNHRLKNLPPRTTRAPHGLRGSSSSRRSTWTRAA